MSSAVVPAVYWLRICVVVMETQQPVGRADFRSLLFPGFWHIRDDQPDTRENITTRV